MFRAVAPSSGLHGEKGIALEATRTRFGFANGFLRVRAAERRHGSLRDAHQAGVLQRSPPLPCPPVPPPIPWGDEEPQPSSPHCKTGGSVLL